MRQFVVLLLIADAFLSSALADDSFAKEVIKVQEELLSSVSPRPTGEELNSDPSYPELVRRVSLLEQNWKHQLSGAKAAERQRKTVVQLPNQSDVDKKFLELLKVKLGFEIVAPPEGLNQEAVMFYAFGFNTKQLEIAKKEIGEDNLRDLIYQAAVALGYKSTSSGSLLFVPWRFSKEAGPTIRGLKDIPHRR